MDVSKVVGLCLAAKVNDTQSYVEAAKFMGCKEVSDVQIFRGGVEDIHQAVCAIVDGEMVVGIRATASAEELGLDRWKEFDWLNNILCDQVPLDGVPGLVHRGFAATAKRLWSAGLKEYLEKNLDGGMRLIVTGYSKGGGAVPALTSIIEWELAHPVYQTDTFMFAAPRCGDIVFQQGFNDYFGRTSQRYEFQDDLITLLAPKDEFLEYLDDKSRLFSILNNWLEATEWNYEHVGNLNFFDWDSNLIQVSDDDEEFRQKRLNSIKEVITSGNYQKLAADHSVPKNMYPLLTGGMELPPSIYDLYN